MKGEIEMKIFDKATWHIDAGETEQETIRKFELIFSYLYQKNLLSPDGLELYELGIDSSISLHEQLVNEAGFAFLNEKYDYLISMSADDLEDQLTKY